MGQDMKQERSFLGDERNQGRMDKGGFDGGRKEWPG